MTTAMDSKTKTDNASQGLMLRIPEIKVTEENPFSEDLFDRRPLAEMLCWVLETADTPAVISLNAEFGSGKSTFLKMCGAELRRREQVAVVELDAWQQRHTGDALVDLMGALGCVFVDDDSEFLAKALQLAGRMARNAGWRLAERLTYGIAAPSSSDDGQHSVTADWQALKQAKCELRETLVQVVQECGDRIVFIIDELDRCPPAYVLDMLDRVRNMLNIPDVIVMYGITRSQLLHAVQLEQGGGTDAAAYLRRFFDREIALPEPDPAQKTNAANLALRRMPSTVRYLRDNRATDWENLHNHVAALLQTRVRDFQQFICAADTTLWLARPEEQRAALTLLALKHCSFDEYEALAHGEADGFGAAAALRPPNATDEWDGDSSSLWMQSILILVASIRDAGLGIRTENKLEELLGPADQFAMSFEEAGAGDKSRARLIYTTADRIINEYVSPAGTRPQMFPLLKRLVSLVEMSTSHYTT